MKAVVGQVKGFVAALRDFAAFDTKACRTRLAGPGTVQLQTVDLCNGSCRMCPFKMPSGAVPRSMDPSLYEDILDQLATTGTVRTLCLMLQNEPLLDRELPGRVSLAKATLGKRVAVQVVTNGTMLTKEIISALGDSGIDQLHISIDAALPETFELIRPGFDLKTVQENAARAAAQLRGADVAVRYLCQRINEAEDSSFAAYWKARGVRVEWLDMNNRAGDIADFEQNARPPRSSLRGALTRLRLRLVVKCFKPFSSMSIRHDGSVLVCNRDWEKDNVVGNLARSRLADVWNGDGLNRYRANLRAGRGRENPLCRRCSVLDS
jgi:radical SAM protein with 4Fe4S-binding SPASM domain